MMVPVQDYTLSFTKGHSVPQSLWLRPVVYVLSPDGKTEAYYSLKPEHQALQMHR